MVERDNGGRELKDVIELYIRTRAELLASVRCSDFT